ncbi:MAG TPA: hypothetical protein PK890_02815 [Terrimesophilobacter sp.]|nr:hypothetical protein [Terrimesophilobacter sp.]
MLGHEVDEGDGVSSLRVGDHHAVGGGRAGIKVGGGLEDVVLGDHARVAHGREELCPLWPGALKQVEHAVTRGGDDDAIRVQVVLGVTLSVVDRRPGAIVLDAVHRAPKTHGHAVGEGLGQRAHTSVEAVAPRAEVACKQSEQRLLR